MYYGDEPPEPRLQEIEVLLGHDIDDPDRRHSIAAMVWAHTRAQMIHYLRECFDQYIGMDGTPPTSEEAMTAMRDSIINLGGGREGEW